MGFLAIPDTMIAVGRVANQLLLRIVRNNFATHELRITDIETNKTTVGTGLVFETGRTTAPTGFLMCDGSEVSRTEYADLFAICGTTFGTPSSGSVFKLPNIQGRVVVGANGSFAIGATGGEESHALTSGENPTHTHSVSESAHSHNGAYDVAGGASGFFHRLNTGGTSRNFAATTLPTSSNSTGITINNTGSSTAHNNIQPSLVVNFMVKT